MVLDDSANTDIPSISDSPTVSVILPDGSLEQKTISNISGTTIIIIRGYISSNLPNRGNLNYEIF